MNNDVSNEYVLDDYFAALLDDQPTELREHSLNTILEQAVNSPSQSDSFAITQSNEDTTELNITHDANEHVDMDNEPVTIVDNDNTTLDSMSESSIDMELAASTVATAPTVMNINPPVQSPSSLEAVMPSDFYEQNPWPSPERSHDFQVLYFEVNEMIFAVPLDELGGIHRITNVIHLASHPDWYLGTKVHSNKQIHVVDTAQRIMSESVSALNQYTYQYIVMLGESRWGLACSKLIGTELLSTEKVHWRKQAGKRPWLAGVIKEKMCVLIHVEAFTTLLRDEFDEEAFNEQHRLSNFI